jgi:hypothetical protein
MQYRAGLTKSIRTFIKPSAVVLLGVFLSAYAGAAPDKAPASQTVDSGSFGVFMGGKRVATETFSIHQSSSGSTITSDFKAEAGGNKAAQFSSLQLTSNGDLQSYEWTESSPGQSHAMVVPNQDFLIERFTKTPQEKQHEQPFLLPASTSILDDYFFIQREVLAWKYLATTCKQENGQIACPLKQSAQLGTLNAHAQASAPISIQYSGREKIPVRGAERDLIRLDIKSEVGDWTLWLDDQLKLQRLVDPTSGTEVIRD